MVDHGGGIGGGDSIQAIICDPALAAQKCRLRETLTVNPPLTLRNDNHQ